MSRHFFSPEMKVLLLYIFINNIEDHLQEEIIIFDFLSVVTEFWGRVIENLV
jgi:hypothetical protein